MKPRLKKLLPWPALAGAALAAICGLLLWGTPLGDPWMNASYDYLFRFGARPVTNQVSLIVMDNDSYETLHQQRNELWDRRLHTQLLRKLTADQSALVIFDVFFKSPQDPATDNALAAEIKRNGHVVLMADVKNSESRDPARTGVSQAGVWPPAPLFLEAAAGCGVGCTDARTGQVVRRHWPFWAPGEGDVHSLAWAAASLLGAPLDPGVQRQWLRYYGTSGNWKVVPYHLALTAPPLYFSNQIVFVGTCPEKPDPGIMESDKFLTPYSRWNSRAVGGTDIMATTFLNLMNGDWLRRPPAWLEAGAVLLAGAILGGGLWRLHRLVSLGVGIALFIAIALAAAAWSYYTNYWFPWLVVAGGQLPCALACAWVLPNRPKAATAERFPGYAVVQGPFGEGAFGKVWLVRNATGQLQALKEVSRSRFADRGPYEREFNGVKSYKPLSNEHPGLLHIDHVNIDESRGCFYYVMELGDPLDPAWEQRGTLYQPRDLVNVCRLLDGGRLPPRECLRIGIVLLEALDFLHQHRLVHRDIKPSNIIFVNGRPKLADVGLVREARPDSTYIGTEGYMPPPPEHPGSTTADLYALGKVLYVISTGHAPSVFPELPTAVVSNWEFMRLNEILCRACQPDPNHRYPDAAAMRAALRAAQDDLNEPPTQPALS